MTLYKLLLCSFIALPFSIFFVHKDLSKPDNTSNLSISEVSNFLESSSDTLIDLSGEWSGIIYSDNDEKEIYSFRNTIIKANDAQKSFWDFQAGSIQIGKDGFRRNYSITAKINKNKLILKEASGSCIDKNLILTKKIFTGELSNINGQLVISGTWVNDGHKVFANVASGTRSLFDGKEILRYEEREYKPATKNAKGRFEIRKNVDINKLLLKQSDNSSISVDDLRKKAIDFYFGKPKIDEKACKNIIDELSAMGDIKSMLWKGLFLATGTCNYFKNADSADYFINYFYREGYNENLKFLNEWEKGDPEYIVIHSLLEYFDIKKDFGNFLSWNDYARKRLRFAIRDNYSPAWFAYSLYNIKESDLSTAELTLSQAYENGYDKAGYNLARFYETYGSKLISNKDSLNKIVLNIYKNLVAKGDQNSNVSLSIFYLNNKDKTLQSIGYKTLDSLRKNGNLNALKFITELKLNADSSSKSFYSLIPQLEKCSPLGHDICLEIALLYINREGFISSKNGFKWIKDAAEKGNNQAMAILGKYYKEGTSFVEANKVKSNYWLREAQLNGYKSPEVGTKTNKKDNKSDLMDRVIDDWFNAEPVVISEKYDQYNNVIVQETTNDFALLNSLVKNALLPLLASLLSEVSMDGHDEIQFIDSIYSGELAMTTYVYSGFINNRVTIANIKLGDKIIVHGDGKVLWGGGILFGPTGTGSFYPERQITDKADWCSLIASINNQNWIDGNYIFSKGIKEIGLNAPSNGTLNLAINSKKENELTGAFRLKIIIKRYEK